MTAPDAPPPRPGAGWDAIDRRIAPTPAGETETPDPRCHVCGMPLAPDQTYCLECGSPTPLAPRFPRPRSGTALVAAALAVLGIGTGALAYAVSGDDESTAAATATTTLTTAPLAPLPTAPSTTTTTVPGVPGVGPLPPDTSGVPTPPPPVTFPTVTSDTRGEVPDLPPALTGPDPATPADPGSDPDDELGDEGLPPGGVPGLPGFDPDNVEPLVPGGGGDDDPPPDNPSSDDPGEDRPPGGGSDWPVGREAWTVQVASVRTRPAAEAIEARLRGTGEPAGILISDDHPELVPGFFVVFSGVYDARASAIAQANGLGLGFPGVFARELSA